MLRLAGTLFMIAGLFAISTVIYDFGSPSIRQFTEAHEVEGTILWIGIVLAAMVAGEMGIRKRRQSK